MKYKKTLNVKCNRLFQWPSRGTLKCYDNCPLGLNISVSAGLSKRYTNQSQGEISTCLDKNEFASSHIVSVTGHKTENSLKTYTGYTDQHIKKKVRYDF